ncbi:FG-GAP-like repeat-containing protein [Hymenobacter sp. GOD-10R]|uniref:FG-GAP-like repeat-containing protein n=1 Tax=Hymenobacter sp. GOD-10R TaxID=3093922 RepID=UPI002D7865C7|nr:FG-GAP-like repeat-containing protein [Hymenobacter sp. GOD-10R]WRQ28441.1 FG-GAP-like repeat-containing protein [Hymenobacter sp. GOD-10R]
MNLSFTRSSRPTRCWAGASSARIFCAGTLLLLASGASAQAPVLTLTVPGRNANSASTTRNVTVGFSELLSNNASTQQALKVFSQQRGGRKAGPTTVQGNTITFDPTTDFVPGETVYGTVTAGAQSTTGVATKPYVFQFTTATSPSTAILSGTTEIPALNTYSDVTLGDIDGDGDLDLLTCYGTAAPAPGGVVLRLNDGTGKFTGTKEVQVGTNPNTVVLADVDSDGDLDILTLNSRNSVINSTVSVRLNDGKGNFSGNQDASVGPFPNSLAVGDLDGDGDLDILTANRNSPSANTLSVRLNDGNGTFSGTQEVPVAAISYSIVARDVDGDGDLDILSSNENSTVSVHLNDGKANFSGSQEIPVSGYYKLAVGDIDGDGDLDFVTANYLPLNGSLSIRRNNGNGKFSGNQEIISGSANALSLSDMDGDGDLDLVTTDYRPEAISVRLNDGTGTFGSSRSVPISGAPFNLALGDVNGDGSLDVAVPTFGIPPSISVRLNILAPTGTLAVTSTSPARNALTAPRTTNVAATFNEALSTGTSTQQALAVFGQQTGKKAGTTTISGNTLTFDPTTDFKPGETVFASITPAAQNSGGANLTLPKTFQFTTATSPSPGLFSAGPDVSVVDPNSTGRPRPLATGDVDGDGDLDFVTTNSFDQVGVRLNTGNGTFTPGRQVPVGVGPLNLVLGDIDKDGDLDLLVASQANGAVVVRLNNGQGIFTGTQEIAPGIRDTFAELSLYDIDGDGDLDLLTSYRVSPSSQDGLVGVFRNDGTGAFSRSQEIALSTYPFSSKPFEVTVGDIDGDGDGDLLVGSELGVSVRLNNGLGIFASTGQEIASSSVWLVQLGDVDADGDLDLLAGITGSVFQVYLNDGLGTFNLKQKLNIFNSVVYFAQGDVDGDGDLDVVFTRNDTNEARVYRNDGTGTFVSGQVVTVGAGPYGVALGDLDADGTLDLLVANYFGNTVSVRLNKGVLANAPAQLTEQVSVYPNPAHTSVRLLLPAELAKQRLQVRIFTNLGQVVLEQQLAGQATPELALPHLAAGVYSLQLQTNQGLVTKRLMVE